MEDREKYQIGKTYGADRNIRQAVFNVLAWMVHINLVKISPAKKLWYLA